MSIMKINFLAVSQGYSDSWIALQSGRLLRNRTTSKIALDRDRDEALLRVTVPWPKRRLANWLTSTVRRY